MCAQDYCGFWANNIVCSSENKVSCFFLCTYLSGDCLIEMLNIDILFPFIALWSPSMTLQVKSTQGNQWICIRNGIITETIATF